MVMAAFALIVNTGPTAKKVVTTIIAEIINDTILFDFFIIVSIAKISKK